MAETNDSRRQPSSEPERRLYRAAMQIAGSIALSDPDLSTRVREKVREKLERRRGDT